MVLMYARLAFYHTKTYREFLRQSNVIAVAPLEGAGGERTQEFVSCKSDIKMVEFGSVGVGAVYSDAPPYQESPLSCGPLVDMGSEQSLADGLERVFLDQHRLRAEAAKSVEDFRLASRVVHTTWLPAIHCVRLRQPLDLELLLERSATFLKYRRETPVAEELFVESDYLSQNEVAIQNEAAISHIGGSGAVYRHYASEGVEAGKVWFPGSVSDAQTLMSKVRRDIMDEDHAINTLSSRVDKAIARIADVRSASQTEAKFKNVAAADGASARAPFRLWQVARLLARSKLGVNTNKNDARALFDAAYYLDTNDDVRLAKTNAYDHYLRHGISERRSPNAFLESAWYAEKYLGGSVGTIDPIVHYLTVGAERGYDPGPRFSTLEYLDLYPDVRSSGMNPLRHYLEIGRAEGRMTKRPTK
jgi:hypothetical protein